MSGRVCTPEQARSLLEALRAAYLTLDPEERQRIKSSMSSLLEEQGWSLVQESAGVKLRRSGLAKFPRSCSGKYSNTRPSSPHLSHFSWLTKTTRDVVVRAGLAKQHGQMPSESDSRGNNRRLRHNQRQRSHCCGAISKVRTWKGFKIKGCGRPATRTIDGCVESLCQGLCAL